MKKILIGVLLFIVGGFIISATVSATSLSQEDRNTVKTEREIVRKEKKQIRQEIQEERKTVKEEKKEIREEIKEKRCERWENRIKTRINRYENKQDQHRRVFDNLVARVKKLMNRFEKSGLNVSQLKADLTTFKEKIKVLYTIHDEFISGLKDTQEYACGKSQGEFRNQLGEVRKMVPEVRKQLIEIREYYHVVIRPDLLDLREQISDMRGDNASEQENGDGNDNE